MCRNIFGNVNIDRHISIKTLDRKLSSQSLNSQLIDLVIEPLPTRKLLDPNAKCKAVKVIGKIQRGREFSLGERSV